jgi:hypothetical protein
MQIHSCVTCSVGSNILVGNLFRKQNPKNLLLSLLNETHDTAVAVDFDWQRLLAIAERSKVLALLFSFIKDNKEKLNVPPGIFSILHDSYRKNALRNALVLDEFHKCADSLNEHNVDCIALKGICFLLSLYCSDPAIRRLEDADILVKPEDVEKACSALEAAGYTFSDRAIGVPSGKKITDVRKAIMFFKYQKDGSVLMPVHLHWHFININPLLYPPKWRAIDMQDVWNRAKPIDSALGKNVLTMCPLHMLLTLCVHALNHGFSRINLLFDVHSVIRQSKDSLDWDELGEYAQKWGLEVALYIGIRLTQEAFATPVPKGFLESLSPEGVSLTEKLFLSYLKRTEFPSEDMSLALYVAMHRGFLDKISFLWKGFSLKLRKAALQ